MAHLVWSSTVIIGFAVTGYYAGIEDPATITAGVLIVLAAVKGEPLFAHVAWTAISLDARRSALDSLTGLYNRRGMDTALEDLWKHARQHRLEIAAIVIDIDKFKQVNDQHDHAIGDQVIGSVADTLVDFAVDIGDDRLNRRRTGAAPAPLCSHALVVRNCWPFSPARPGIWTAVFVDSAPPWQAAPQARYRSR
ncbi:GGDEF domain-containing protein [Rhodococcus sp. G-MC3]|uniref:GGDEF domain-containing protein n=1 Tax=Rhodococcus sp. G-MC3 TaxID=3046209 RepID=UPI0024B91914|nr:GGDEF domain-containing protein [Rhodococcus sp. G-MC3]MDJ0396721.1 GGDEF domain-containing protein [Rhodococcus sp. G-MC3]